MSIELAAWRAVAEHLDMHDVIEELEPQLKKKFRWLSGIVVIEVDELRAEANCVAAVGDGVAAWLQPAHRVLPEQALSTWQRWVEHRQAIASHAMTNALRRLVGAVSEDRAFALLPLIDELGAKGMALFVAREGVMPRNPRSLSILREPFTCALRNTAGQRELQRLRAAAEADREALLQRLHRDELSESIVGADSGLSAVFEQLPHLTAEKGPLLLLGETGSGKEVVARAIHRRSRRSEGPFLRVNCATLEEERITEALYGREAGNNVVLGWFERAMGGTLMLDKIDELPAPAQQSILRVLQSGTFQRQGGARLFRADVGLVAASSGALHTRVRHGHFREDLWYLLSRHVITLPPLRERKEDIASLARYFAERAAARLGGQALSISDEEIRKLMAYDWPGNARELASVVERAAILGDGRGLAIDLALGNGSAARRDAMQGNEAVVGSIVEGRRLTPLERSAVETISHALCASQGVIEGNDGAAARLGIHPSTLRSRMRKLGIAWQRFRAQSSKPGS